jgi:hypothetical protein
MRVKVRQPNTISGVNGRAAGVFLREIDVQIPKMLERVWKTRVAAHVRDEVAFGAIRVRLERFQRPLFELHGSTSFRRPE